MPETLEERSPLARLIQLGLLLIVALMPIHAFLSVWLGSLTHHEAVIQSWKEVVLLALAAIAAVLVSREPTRLSRLRQPWVLLASGFALVASLVTLVAQPTLPAASFGLKTDLEVLLAAILAALVTDAKFMQRIAWAVVGGAGVVVGFGLLQIFVLPPDFLTHFGYGPNTILPYQHITRGATSLRFPSTLGGPNQLGTYLILPLCLSLTIALRRRYWWLLGLTAGGLVVLAGTYSRGAWIGALAAVAIVIVAETPTRLRRPLMIGLALLATLAAVVLSATISTSPQLQYYLLHSSLTSTDTLTSDSQHASSLLQGAHAVLSSPLGHGLGTAGPATFHAGTTNIIENYYLQLGYETGLLGLLLFVGIVVAISARLWRLYSRSPLALAAASALLGVSLVALVLPSWTDSTTALVTWTCAGAAASVLPARSHNSAKDHRHV